MTVKRPLLRYFGGKWVMGQWILSHFPEHHTYVETHGGGASVLLRKPRCCAEVYNDLDEEIVNLFRVVRDRGDELGRAISLTPFARAELELSYQSAPDRLEQARRTLARSYMGFGTTLTRLTRSARLMRTGFRSYSKKNRRSIPAHDWKTWPGCLPAIIERLQGVVIENRDAAEVISAHDGPQTLFYVDPCYVHSTRGRPDGYRHEMTERDHVRLAKQLRGVRGKVVLSGYPSALYQRLYGDWITDRRPARADGAKLRTEVLWMNFQREAA